MRKIVAFRRKRNESIVSCGCYEHRLAIEGIRPLPDANMMALCERVVLFLQGNRRRLSFQVQNRHWRLAVATIFNQSPRGFHLRFAPESTGWKPARIRERLRNLVLSPNEHEICHVG